MSPLFQGEHDADQLNSPVTARSEAMYGIPYTPPAPRLRRFHPHTPDSSTALQVVLRSYRVECVALNMCYRKLARPPPAFGLSRSPPTPAKIPGAGELETKLGSRERIARCAVAGTLGGSGCLKCKPS